MKESLNFKGRFKIESLDQDNNLIDVWEEDNLIMDSARESMAEIFSLLSTNTGISKVVFGTKGHNVDIRIPKTSNEGFVNTRNRLFSESIDITDGELITVLTGDVVRYTGTANATGTQNNYYEYTGSGVTTTVGDIDFNVSWTDLGTDAPYTYSVTFDLPGINSGNGLNIAEDDGAVGSSMEISQSGNEVQFIYNLSTLAGNQADDPVVGSSTFTEAAMYANGRIFSMKTFGSKIKDSTVVLKITWTIAF